MTISASEEGLGLRERKRRATRASVVSVSRRLTLEHGLSGFTIEQLCDEVGISRRTFFNYFPSKEDAVLGHSDDEPVGELLAEFSESGRGTAPTPLIDALTTLFVELATRMGISREDYESMSALLQREPQLLARMFARTESKSQVLTELIAAREGLPPDHPRARVATLVLGGIAHRSMDEFFAEGNHLTYAELFGRNIDALRSLFPTPDRPVSPNEEPA